MPFSLSEDGDRDEAHDRDRDTEAHLPAVRPTKAALLHCGSSIVGLIRFRSVVIEEGSKSAIGLKHFHNTVCLL